MTPAPVIPDPDIPDTRDPAPDPTTPDPEEEEEPEEDEDEEETDVGIPPEGGGDQDPDTPILDEPEPPDFVTSTYVEQVVILRPVPQATPPAPRAPATV